MATTSPRRTRTEQQQQGIQLLFVIVALMWVVEVINSLDANALDAAGIYPRDVDRIWGIVTAPFLHASYGHLISNTIPLVFMGLIIALRGAARVAAVTLIVILLGGLGTWLIAPGGSITIGASGVVFGYATYLLSRGVFNRSSMEIVVGAIVALVWGGALLASLVPHSGVSRQAHVCGAIAGVIAARMLAAPGPRASLPSGGLRDRPRRLALAPTRALIDRRPRLLGRCGQRLPAPAGGQLRWPGDADLLRHPADRPQAPRQLHRRDHPVRRRPGAR